MFNYLRRYFLQGRHTRKAARVRMHRAGLELSGGPQESVGD